MTRPSSDLVTVLVPAKNEERSIAGCLRSILSQDHANLEVIVLDADSDDATADIVRRFERGDPRVRLIRHHLERIPQSLNLGLAHARGRWIVRVDAHSTIAGGYVRRAVEHLGEGRWGGVGGRKDGVGSTPTGEAIAQAMASRFGVGGSTYHFGTGSGTVDHIPFGSYATDLLRELGGWDGSLHANEDFELDYRIRALGYELLFDPSIRIAYETRDSIPDLFRQYRRYGRGKADVARLHPGSLEPRHFAAPGFVLGLAAALVAAPRRPKVAVTAVAPYVVALVGASAVVAARVRDARAASRLPLAFLAMHLGWGLGFWEGLLAANLRHRKRSRHPAPPASEPSDERLESAVPHPPEPR